MKKLFTAICLALVTATALAIPAKKGLYTTLKLDNGTEVRAQLCGDEHLKFYLADDGTSCQNSTPPGRTPQEHSPRMGRHARPWHQR